MAQQVDVFIENNFTKGLITEGTGLNFPENAATATDNCEFTLIGDVNRRLGITKESKGVNQNLTRINKAINSYKWNNVGGDGSTQVVVKQVGNILYFYRSSSATAIAPLSTTLLASTVDISTFTASGGSFDVTQECQFTDGNGYLFGFHPSCDPFFCVYKSSDSTITATVIDVKIRDFVGVPEAVADTTRLTTLSNEHLYNLLNQGWYNTATWQADSTTVVPWASLVSPTNVNNTFVVSAGLPIVAGTPVRLQATIFDGAGGSHFISNATGVVVSYAGTNLIVNTNPIGYGFPSGSVVTEQWAITPQNVGGQLGTWQSSIGNYPSNSDVWWNYKDSLGIFNPLGTFANVTLSSPAPKGSLKLSAFNQNKNAAFGGSGINSITTTVRPTNGTWFQGRIWYTGVNAQQVAVGNAPYYTWTENIYFSQIVQTVADFAKCYQVNDPTSETLFDLLPTDGGVITIQGSGAIYKLFPLVNALIVFAANGVWYITGSAGIGFTANDYTIVKLSSVRSISSTSFVDVQGLPMFWNEEGIYKVEPAKQGTSLLSSPLHVQPLEVNPITVGTILSFYNQIPITSKKYAKGAYHPIDYVVQWVYRDTDETDITSRYTYNKILNYNSHNSAFFPYTIDSTDSSINGILYLEGPGGSTSPSPVFKYPSSNTQLLFFAEEYDPTYIDWGSTNYISFFITGYKLKGQAIKKFQPQYLQLYTRLNGEANSYKVQNIWDYANHRDSGRWSTIQQVNHGVSHYDTVHKRIKLRGNGYAFQFKITSTDGMPFDIQGWAAVDTVNAGT